MEGEYWKRVNGLTRAFPDARRTLEALRATHRLALVSNTQGQAGGDAHRLSEFPGLERVFECIVIAGENGIAAKPDAQPFVRCLQQMKLDPGDCFLRGRRLPVRRMRFTRCRIEADLAEAPLRAPQLA